MSTRMVALGDSIYAGFTGKNNVVPSQRIPDLVAAKLGWQCDNEAISGAHLVGTSSIDFLSVVRNLNFKNYDVCLMSFGVNDFDWSTPSVNDLPKALDEGVAKIRKDNPTIQIYYELPTATWRWVSTLDQKGPKGWTQTQMRNLLAQECSSLGIAYYDWTDPIITYANRKTTLGDGIVHPTAETMMAIADRLADWLGGSVAGFIGNYVQNISGIYNRIKKLKKNIYSIFAQDGEQLDLTITPPKETLLNRAVYLWTIDSINHLQRVMNVVVDMCNQFGIVDTITGQVSEKLTLWVPRRLAIDDIYTAKLKQNFKLCNQLLDQLEEHMKIYQ